MEIISFARIFCNLIHICKNLQKYTELCHTENDKGGNKLEKNFSAIFTSSTIFLKIFINTLSEM